MKLKHLWKVIRGKTSALNPAKIDLPHIWAVIQSWFRSILPTPEHIQEQIEWRAQQVQDKSPRCWQEGNCIQCGCVIREKIKADMGCENPPYCYPPMVSKKEWQNFKTNYDRASKGPNPEGPIPPIQPKFGENGKLH